MKKFGFLSRVHGCKVFGVCFSSTGTGSQHFKLLVIGGGSGGCTVANKFGSKLGKDNVAVIEPQEIHYYQPLWTLVGGRLKNFEQSSKRMADVIRHAYLIKDEATRIDPQTNKVLLKNNPNGISYDYLLVACGLQLRFDLIKGLPEAFGTPGVCSNYHPEYVKKTRKAIEEFKSGNAIFTFPNTPIKCPGAPQKIMYIVEDYFRKHGKRDKVNVMYNTSLGVIFGVQKYAAILNEICKQRNISVNLRHTLKEVRPEKKEAVFSVLDATGKPLEDKIYLYELLHVGPPCSAPPLIRNAPELVDSAGWLDVDRDTLQHKKFPNIFGIGDCTNLPGTKTAAGVAAQSGILRRNLTALMSNEKLPGKYEGYTSCPLVTSANKCIMAEFSGFTGEPMETFPFDQGKELRSMYWIKAQILPFLYWNLFLPGWWEGPAAFRKLFHFGR